MSQILTLNAVRDSNAERHSSNQEYVGGIFFIGAVGTVTFCILLANIMAYALPLRRLEDKFPPFGNPKFTSVLYACLVVTLYVCISLAGGLTGYIVSAVIVFCIFITLLVVIVIRRFVMTKTEDDAHDGVEAGNDEGGFSMGMGQSQRAGGLGRRASLGFGKVRRAARDKNSWTMLPAPMAQTQLFVILGVLGFFVLSVVVALVVTIFWKVPVYKLVDQGDFTQEEYQPQLAAKTLQFTYAFPKTATFFRLGIYSRLLTEICGTRYTKTLSEGDKKSKIYDEWIKKYNIDMSIYVKKNYTDYSSVNEWFTRAIDLTQRPQPAAQDAILSPADCRMTVYRSLTDSDIWFKGYTLDYRKLIDNYAVDGNTRYFENGGLMIARLAPQDYHRFHSPVAGVIERIFTLSGEVFSVSADAVRSGNDVFMNQRKVVIIDAGARIGRIAYVAIGATCVGSVLLQRDTGEELKEKSFVKRGEQLGIMQFGGSTVAVLFPGDRAVFDDNVLYRSRFPVESYVLARSQIGRSR